MSFYFSKFFAFLRDFFFATEGGSRRKARESLMHIVCSTLSTHTGIALELLQLCVTEDLQRRDLDSVSGICSRRQAGDGARSDKAQGFKVAAWTLEADTCIGRSWNSPRITKKTYWTNTRSHAAQSLLSLAMWCLGLMCEFARKLAEVV